MDALYFDLIPGKSVAEAMEPRFTCEQSPKFFRDHTVAEEDDKVAGALNFFAVDDPRSSWSDRRVPEERKAVVKPIEHLKPEDELYIGFVAVYSTFRGKGIGRTLLAFARSEARRRGLASLCLHVFEQNEGAMKLYRDLGFQIAKRHPVVAHDLIIYSGDLLLMTCAV